MSSLLYKNMRDKQDADIEDRSTEIIKRCPRCNEPIMVEIKTALYIEDLRAMAKALPTIFKEDLQDTENLIAAGMKIGYQIPCDCFYEDKIAETTKTDAKARYDKAEKITAGTLLRTPEMQRCTIDMIDTLTRTEQNGTAIDFCRRYIDNYPKFTEFAKQGKKIGITFYGEMGTGKSTLAAIIANGLRQKYSAAVLMDTTPRFINQMRTASKCDGLYPYATLAQYADLLVLDDFGTERDTEFTAETLYEIVNSRMNNHLPVIITTNIDVKKTDWKQPSFAKTLDRLRQICTNVEIAGKSWRK